MNKYIKENFGITDEVLGLIEDAEKDIKSQFERVDKIAQINQLKVMKAFSDNRVSEAHFAPTTGYGYDDIGRDTLDKVYAQVFDAEDALVRHNFVNGTHALSTMLFGVMRPGDLLVSATGKPYDTLEEAIGITGKQGNGSLKDFGVDYKEIALLNDGTVDFESLNAILKEHF